MRVHGHGHLKNYEKRLLFPIDYFQTYQTDLPALAELSSNVNWKKKK